jgi:hypothetical protein
MWKAGEKNGVPGKPTGVSRWIERLRKDRAFRRRVLMVAGFMVAFCAEVFLLANDLPAHHDLVKHFLVWAALVLLPLTIPALLARSPWGQAHIQQHFIIRPFETLTTHPTFDGSALACLLDREIGLWRIKARVERQMKGQGEGGSHATISYGGASVSLEWVSMRFRHALTGKKDIRVEGLLMDAEPPFKLRAWTSTAGGNFGWEVALNEGPFNDALQLAVEKLAFEVLEAMVPQTAATIDSYRWRDADAIRLLRSEDNTPALNIQLATATLDAGFLEETERVLKQLEPNQLKPALRWELRALLVELKLAQGKFGDAEKLLREWCGDTACKLSSRFTAHRKTADALAYQGQYANAISAYDQAFRFVESGLHFPGIVSDVSTGASRWKQFASVIPSSPIGATNDDRESLLLDAQEALTNRARCRSSLLMLEKDEAQGMREGIGSDLAGASELLTARDALTTFEEQTQAALLYVSRARYQLDYGGYKQAEELAIKASNCYEHVILQSQRDLRGDELDMRAKANAAWGYFGQTVCSLIIHFARTSSEAARRQEEQVQQQEKDTAEAASPAENESGAEDADSAEVRWIAAIIQRMPETDRNQVIQEINRANVQRDAERREKCLWNAALLLSASLLRRTNQGAENLADLVVENSSLSLEADETVIQKVDTLAWRYAPQTDLNVAEVRRMYFVLHGALQKISVSRNVDRVNEQMDTAAAMVRVEESEKRSRQEFEELGGQTKRAAAESAYGLACLAALHEDGRDDATDLLTQAAVLAGENNFFYRNRAALDKEFDPVRRHPRFQKVMQSSASVEAGL